jgi:hypothetical protein
VHNRYANPALVGLSYRPTQPFASVFRTSFSLLSGKQAGRDKRILALGIALPSEMNLTYP